MEAVNEQAAVTGINRIETLTEYFDAYGGLLGDRAIEALSPLYVPGVTPGEDISYLGRAPFPCQANVIQAAIKGWQRQRSLIVCGEMGTGKTLIAMAAIDAAARAAGKTGYRALVFCPNHLIDKWKEEIEETIPGSTVRTFERSSGCKADDSYKEVLQYVRSCSDGNGRWRAATTPEWSIIGQNQSKRDAGLASIAESAEYTPCVRQVVAAWDDKIDPDTGRKVWDAEKRRWAKVATTVESLACPACGQPVRSTSGVIAPAETMAQADHGVFCRARYLQEIPDPANPKKRDGLDRIVPSGPDAPYWAATYNGTPRKGHRPGQILTFEGGARYEIRECGEPLWQWTPTPRKWAPARIIQSKAKRLFDYFVLDEMHEQKSATSGQGLAAGKIISACKRVIGLTGTLIAGRADHLFPLLYRLAPESLVNEGFPWGSGGEEKFAQAYGRIDTVVTTTYGKEDSPRRSKSRRASSMRKGGGKQKSRKDVKPGVMPSMFGQHLMAKSIFVSLEEMHDDLPELIDDDRSLIEVQMDDDQKAAYEATQAALVAENADLMLQGNMKLLGTMLHTLLAYPNSPFNWNSPPGCDGMDAVGWWDDADDKVREGYHPVWSPRNLDPSRIFPKEQALLDLVAGQVARGRQTWVYCEQTGIRDIQERLAGLIRAKGFTCKILRSSTCDARDRREWISANAPGVDVMISNPTLVATGLDFFDRAGSFNFPTIVTYQPTYQLSKMRQAGRRHWRIGQPEVCENYYLFYHGTMEHRAVKLVGDKLAAARSLEGKFSEEGLAAMAGDEGLAMTQMAKMLSAKVGNPRAAWARLRGVAKQRAEETGKLTPELLAALEEFDLDELDGLDTETVSRFQDALAELGLSAEDIDDPIDFD